MLNVIGVFTEKEIHWVNLLVGLGLALVWAGLVFGLRARWAERTPGRAAWAGVACVLVGAVTAGTAAIVLGAAALALDVAAYASDVASRF